MQSSEYHALRDAVALVETDDAVLDMEGKDAFTFLHRMVANDLKALAAGQGKRSLLLDLKGHVIGDMAVLRTGESDVTIVVARSAAGDVEQTFSKYGIADDFQIAASDAKVLTLQGPKALEALALEGPVALKELEHVKTPVGGVMVRLVRHDRSGRGGYDLIVPAAEVGKVKAALRALPASEAALDLVRLEAGRSRFGRDFGPDTIPQEARLEEKDEDALSFDKGCFFGQEVVARLRFRGHVNRLLVPLVVTGDAEAGAALSRDGKEVGRITSLGRSPALAKTIALGFVRREHATEGTVLEAGVAGSGGVLAHAKVVRRGWDG